MLIKTKQHLILELDSEEYKSNPIYKDDFIIYRGDTYIVYEIDISLVFPNTVYVKLDLFKRAVNFHAIDMNDNLFKVMDYRRNCKK